MLRPWNGEWLTIESSKCMMPLRKNYPKNSWNGRELTKSYFPKMIKNSFCLSVLPVLRKKLLWCHVITLVKFEVKNCWVFLFSNSKGFWYQKQDFSFIQLWIYNILKNHCLEVCRKNIKNIQFTQILASVPDF